MLSLFPNPVMLKQNLCVLQHYTSLTWINMFIPNDFLQPKSPLLVKWCGHVRKHWRYQRNNQSTHLAGRTTFFQRTFLANYRDLSEKVQDYVIVVDPSVHLSGMIRNVLNMLYTNPQIQLILKLLHNKCMLYICDTSEDVVRKRWSTFFSFFPLIRNKFEYGTSIDDRKRWTCIIYSK